MGVNVVLISRSKDKLEKVADEIRSITSVQIKIIDADFTKGPEIYERIGKELSDLEIGTLVNNVGMSYENPEFFLSIPNSDKLLRDIVECNIHSVTHMCKVVMPAMLERKKGLIINISSMSAVVASPLLTLYAATKAFVDKFSSDLNIEYQGKGITVQCVLPGFVATNMSGIKKESFLAPSSDTFVASALQTLGISSRTTGHFPHSLMKLAIDIVKAVTCEPATGKMSLKSMLNIRKRALRKKAQ